MQTMPHEPIPAGAPRVPAPDPPDPAFWAAQPLGRLIDFLVGTYHARLRREIPDLIAMAGTVEQSHAGHPLCPRGLTDHLRAMHAAVLLHLEKEEKVLFPMIRSGFGASASGPIRVMEMEHDDHADALARMRVIAGGLAVPAEGCATWRALYGRLEAFEAELNDHIRIENNVLFPGALQHI